MQAFPQLRSCGDVDLASDGDYGQGPHDPFFNTEVLIHSCSPETVRAITRDRPDALQWRLARAFYSRRTNNLNLVQSATVQAVPLHGVPSVAATSRRGSAPGRNAE